MDSLHWSNHEIEKLISLFPEGQVVLKVNGDLAGCARYLDLRIPKGYSILLDFNKAYNPLCAYNGRYSCPIPPPENHINFKIKAGVRYEVKH